VRSLVTGGAGFIGSSLVRELVARGDDVTVIDDLSRGRRNALPEGVRLHRADVADAVAMRALLRARRPDRVFHLAAHTDVNASLLDGADDTRVNVAGTVNVLEAARAAGVGRVVFASSAAVYGPTQHLPTPESAQPRPESCYGQGKLAGEDYCRLFTRVHGLETVCLRLSNVYGPRQRPEGEAGVVALFSRAAVGGEEATIFNDGSQTRDFVHVADVAAAMIAAAEAPDAAGQTFNVASGRETTLLDVLGAVQRAAGGGPQPRMAPARAGDVPRSCLDPSRAQQQLAWQARMPIERGLADTVAWMHGHAAEVGTRRERARAAIVRTTARPAAAAHIALAAVRAVALAALTVAITLLTTGDLSLPDLGHDVLVDAPMGALHATIRHLVLSTLLACAISAIVYRQRRAAAVRR